MPKKYPTIFDLIATEFKKAGIKYLLVGDYALNVYKDARYTQCIDFMVAEESAFDVEKLLRRRGFQQLEQKDNFIRWKKNLEFPYTLDFMFVEQPNLTKLIRQGRKIQIAGHEISIPSMEYLIADKLFNKPLSDPPPLSMDEYHQFVLMNLKLFPKQNQPDQRPVDVPFSLN